VSRGSEHDIWPGLTVTNPKRNSSEHITVTVVLYNAIVGGVPSVDDVKAAIDDMEQLYAACSTSGQRAEWQFADVNAPLYSQPPPSNSTAPTAPLALPPVPGGMVFTVGTTFKPQGRAPEELVLRASQLPLNRNSFTYLHDTVGLAWLQAGIAGGRVADAFHAFYLSNNIWVELHGEPNNVALYNMACCLSVAADGPPAVVNDILGPVATAEGNPQKKRVDLALDAAVKYLRMSCATGYSNHQHMATDPDLNRLRASRQQAFAALYQQFMTWNQQPTPSAPTPVAFSTGFPAASAPALLTQGAAPTAGACAGFGAAPASAPMGGGGGFA